MFDDSFDLIDRDDPGFDIEALSELFELESRRYCRKLSEEDEARQR